MVDSSAPHPQQELPSENPKEAILKKTAKEYFNSAEDEFSKSRYNSAVVLYFKSLIALVDIYIFKKTGNTPSSHTDRFNLVRSSYPDVYDLLDKDFHSTRTAMYR